MAIICLATTPYVKGNPLNWRNSSSMTWEGRRLASQTLNNGDTLTYVYNSDGIRTQKEFYDDSIGEFYTYEYILDGNRIISETVYMGITRLYTMNYFYDETGVAGFEFEGAEFYYLKNLQGDIIEILSSDGTSVVQYTYDAWGKVISVTGTLKNGIGKYNPFRYRGYYYDTETGLYYLNSRYYDPEVCRFINADGIIGANGGIQGYNMFAYCNNNPVMYVDFTGQNSEAAAAWYSTAWWLVGIDTLFSVGDIIYGLGGVCVGIVGWAVGKWTATEVSTPSIYFDADDNESEKHAVNPSPDMVEPESIPQPNIPEVTYPGDDPTKAPDGTEWRGSGEQGGNKGNYYNPETGESWHPDLKHPDPIGPHWDYRDPFGTWWRVRTGNIITIK